MNIYQKISAIMKAVSYLSKDDTVAFGNTKYKAVSEEKVTSAVREKLIEQGLVIFPIAQTHKREGTLTTVDVTYRIVNTENPDEFIDVVSSGTGADTQDKGVGKAMTYAYKYMLLRTFAIPTGEDPDKIASAQLDEETKRKPKSNVLSGKDVSTLRRYFKEHDISETKILKGYKVKRIEEIGYDLFCTIIDAQNLSYYMTHCGIGG